MTKSQRDAAIHKRARHLLRDAGFSNAEIGVVMDKTESAIKEAWRNEERALKKAAQQAEDSEPPEGQNPWGPPQPFDAWGS